MKKLLYKIGKSSEIEQLMLDYEDGLSRTVHERISLGLLPLNLPVVNQAAYRIFETLEDYRLWSDTNMPAYLGYYRSND
jgi:hypothetical protein